MTSRKTEGARPAKTIRLASALLVAATAAGIGAVVGDESPGNRQVTNEQDAPPRVVSSLAALRRPQTVGDRLPQDLARQFQKLNLSFVATTERFLSASSSQRSWVAMNKSGDVCHIVSLKPMTASLPVSNASCVRPSIFLTRGISAVVQSRASGVRTALIPDGFLNSLHEKKLTVTVATPNLLIFPFSARYSRLRLCLRDATGNRLMLVGPPALEGPRIR